MTFYLKSYERFIFKNYFDNNPLRGRIFSSKNHKLISELEQLTKLTIDQRVTQAEKATREEQIRRRQ